MDKLDTLHCDSLGPKLYLSSGIQGLLVMIFQFLHYHSQFRIFIYQSLIPVSNYYSYTSIGHKPFLEKIREVFI